MNVPQLTEDRRKELVKDAKRLGEDGKVAIRNIRRDAVDTLKKLAKNIVHLLQSIFCHAGIRTRDPPF